MRLPALTRYLSPAWLIGLSRQKFVRASFFYFAAELYHKAQADQIVPLLTRLLLPAEYGLVAIYTSLISVFIVIFSGNVSGGVNRYYFENRADFPAFLGSQFFFTFATALVCFGAAFVFSAPLAAFFALPEDMFLLLLGVTAGRIVSGVYLNLLKAQQRSFLAASLQASMSTLTFALSILFLVKIKSRTYLGIPWADLIVSALFGLGCLWVLLRPALRVFRWSDIRYTLVFNLTSMPGAISEFIIAFISRIMIGHRSLDEAGQYSFAYNIGMLILLATGSIFLAWLPNFIHARREQDHARIQRFFDRNLRVILGAALALILLSKPGAWLLGREGYFGALTIIPEVVTGYILFFIGRCYGLYVFFRKATMWFNSLSLIVCGLLNIGLNHWLLPVYGYHIAGFNTLLSYAAFLLFQWINARILLREPVFSLRPSLGFLVAYGLAAVYLRFAIF